MCCHDNNTNFKFFADCVCVCAVGIFCDWVLLFFSTFKLSISAAAVFVADQLSLVCVLCFDNLLPAIL